MKCSVYIATSADGYIATPDGDVDWLHSAGNSAADMSNNPDMGFTKFITSIDCMIMGRKCMEAISGFNLTAEQWPYGNIKIYVLSNTIKEPPANLQDKVEMYSGDITQLISQLEASGYKHAYIDGGVTITAFINLGLINEMTITKAPVILGKGIPLFGEINNSIKLTNAEVTGFANDFIQVKYTVAYL
ncbi:dihydrofolate reductase family protein [Colwellia sp. D2M02]|uniref:dihydrofolate reductase family protein n=1 Tax=Colwellia sp. D2M02 TaxID=2841562 RepID=UPI001C093B0C|nr:dihydrofolate reductase family protein [Colwellia sp. D2M02]MBU2891976.1 dihydrofolate reductase family protein [Colwellia sp. D2M02]